MLQLNYYVVLGLGALVPLLLGFIWYHPKLFGTAWMNATGLDETKAKDGFNMPLVFGVTFLLGIFIAFGLTPIVIHQFGFFGMMEKMIRIKDTAGIAFFTSGIQNYSNEFRTFRHGMLHGTITGVTLALPIVAINALFERKGFKYIAINAGYWILCFCLIGGLVCQFADVKEVFQP